jgi:hypothetical protein
VKSLLATFSLMALVLLVAAPAWALDATLAWDARTESDLAWYKIYRAPGACANPGAFAMVRQVNKTATSNPTTTTDTLPAGDGTYCYKATAGDTVGNESVFSNTSEVVANQVPPMAPQNFRATVGQ